MLSSNVQCPLARDGRFESGSSLRTSTRWSQPPTRRWPHARARPAARAALKYRSPPVNRNARKKACPTLGVPGGAKRERAEAAGAWDTDDYPTRLEFDVTAAGAAAPSTKMTLESDGILDVDYSEQIGSFLAVGAAVDTDVHVKIYDAAIDTANGYDGIYSYHKKTAGATDEADDFYGIYSEMRLDHNGGVIGHLIGAASGTEAIASILAIQKGIIHPSINLFEMDPEIDLNIPSQAPVESPVKNVLSNSFGFGGQNATLIISRFTG